MRKKWRHQEDVEVCQAQENTTHVIMWSELRRRWKNGKMEEVKIPGRYWKRMSTGEHYTLYDVVTCSELRRGWKNGKMEEVKISRRYGKRVSYAKHSRTLHVIWCSDV